MKCIVFLFKKKKKKCRPNFCQTIGNSLFIEITVKL